MLSGGEYWSGNTYAKAIAFGWLNHQQVVGVTLSSDEGNRYEIYLIVPGRTTLHFLCAGGTGWGPGRFATAIAFEVLGGRPVVGVTRNHGDNQRFEISYMNQKTDGTCELVALVDGCGSDWGDGRGGTGIAFGQINGKGLVGVTRNAGDNAELFLYQYEVDKKVGALVGYSTQSVDWSEDKDATCIAIGFLGGMNVVGYGRSKGKGSRGGILGWSA